jgi:GTP pyrophosphokinase
VYVFTPKGDLLKFPKGATILDFAYHRHSGIGNTCVGGRINGKAVSIREVLHSGDTIEILTQSNQKPKRDWINLVYTSRAKSKIRLAIKDAEHKDGILAKEALERRFKNKKVDVEESIMSHTIKKLGFKVVSDFYRAIADEKLDINTVVDKYINIRDHELNPNATVPTRSAEEFNYYNPSENIVKGNDDVLVIDRNLKGLEFSLAKCCRPIYGDPVFGFVTVNGGIKVHRQDCPNAAELRKRFGYRIVKARWSGKGTSQYSITLRIIGNDDIGIVNNITNIISKEEKIMMRSININSHDGLFSGNLDVILEDTSKLEALLKKLRTIRGVKQVIRI